MSLVIAAPARAACLLLLGLSIAIACDDGGGEGVLVRLRVERDEHRPDHVLLTWRWPGGVLTDVRVPEQGELPRTGAELAAIRFELGGARAGRRELEARGMRGGRPISGARTAVEWRPGERLDVQLTLGCVDEAGSACPPPADDAGAGDAETVPEVAAETTTPELAPDAGLPDAGAPDAALIDVLPPEAPPDVAPTLDAAPEGPPPIERPAPLPGVDLETGLVLYLAFEDPAATVARDSSMHRNQAGLINLDPARAWVTGRVGQGIELPGGENPGFISVTTSPSLNQISAGLSVALWLRTPATLSGRRALIARAASAGGALFGLALVDGRPALWLNSAHAASASFTSSTTLERERWVHLALIYDRASARLYVNGQPAGAVAYQLGFAPEVTPLVIGAAAGGASSLALVPFAGRLDEIAVYDRPLAPAELRALATGYGPPLH